MENNEFINYITSLNSKCNLLSYEYIEKFFASLNFKGKILIMDNQEEHCMRILEDFDKMFWKVDSIFNLGEEFAFRYIKEIFLRTNYRIRKFIYNEYDIDEDLTCYSVYDDFFSGIKKFQFLYLISYNNYTNYKDDFFSLANEKMFYLFLKFLSHDDIINIFKMNNVKYRIIECEMAEVVEKIINKFKYIPNIKIRKNELLKEKYSIVKYFLENIDKYKLRFNEFGFYNAIECIEKNSVKKIKIASLRLKYNSKFFKLKFAQYNLKLMVWIYNENDIFLYKDIIYRIEDLDRIFLFIKDI